MKSRHRFFDYTRSSNTRLSGTTFLTATDPLHTVDAATDDDGRVPCVAVNDACYPSRSPGSRFRPAAYAALPRVCSRDTAVRTAFSNRARLDLSPRSSPRRRGATMRWCA